MGYSQLRDADMIRFDVESVGRGYEGSMSLDDVSKKNISFLRFATLFHSFSKCAILDARFAN